MDGTKMTFRDRLYAKAVKHVIETQRCSVSDLQRTLLIGYFSADEMVARMESDGVVAKRTKQTPIPDVLLDDFAVFQNEMGE